jgi:hypothetical protein
MAKRLPGQYSKQTKAQSRGTVRAQMMADMRSGKIKVTKNEVPLGGIGKIAIKTSLKLAKAIAREAAGPKAKAPFGKLPKVSKPNAGSGLSKSEKARDAYYKSNKNPVTVKQGAPKKTVIKSQREKDFYRKKEIRAAISNKPSKPNPRAALPKHKTNVTIAGPKKTMSQILDPLKGKKIKTGGTDKQGNDQYMDAQEYVLTQAKMRLAGKNPKNSGSKLSRGQEKTRADAAEARATKAARREEIISRARDMRDTAASKANPRRYSSPEKEYGNRRQTEGLVAEGEKRISEALLKRRQQQEQISKTAKRRKEIEATLQRQKNRERILAETRKKSTIKRGSKETVIRGKKVRENRARRDMGLR